MLGHGHEVVVLRIIDCLVRLWFSFVELIQRGRSFEDEYPAAAAQWEGGKKDRGGGGGDRDLPLAVLEEAIGMAVEG